MNNVKRIFCLVFITVLCINLFMVSVYADSPNDLLDFSAREILENQEGEIVEVTLRASPVTPSTSNGFHSVILSLLGNYEPVTVDYEYRTGNNTYYSHNITTAPDWSWICSAGIFALVVFCVLRIIGSIISGVNK